MKKLRKNFKILFFLFFIFSISLAANTNTNPVGNLCNNQNIFRKDEVNKMSEEEVKRAYLSLFTACYADFRKKKLESYENFENFKKNIQKLPPHKAHLSLIKTDDDIKIVMRKMKKEAEKTLPVEMPQLIIDILNSYNVLETKVTITDKFFMGSNFESVLQKYYMNYLHDKSEKSKQQEKNPNVNVNFRRSEANSMGPMDIENADGEKKSKLSFLKKYPFVILGAIALLVIFIANFINVKKKDKIQRR
ncbi:MAG: hypothetical protein HQK51_06730 [Oligoflexia bacterium]|nr:hypothetical protein [Oligoflexia bacterium]